ncbi:asparagine synthase (glutamine-hydrolyzing) [Rheinheimera pacifica]|nr:asparagine synthase (glutamine-hydrolyzing) [Rheinheimera pacifica]
MCGFSGFIAAKSSQLKPDLVLQSMLGKISHRGPDDSGIWLDGRIAFGHQRLSIHDLSPLGHQPMHSASGRFVVVFNGEIYNFQHLRMQLVRLGKVFYSDSDTEVLLAAIEVWGVENSLKQFVGMFAFALWDKQEKKLFLARDRIGEKPLYYSKSEDGIVFGSQLGALAVHPDVDKEIDRNALGLYLRHGYIPAPHSIYVNTYKLMPGCYLEIAFNRDRLVFSQPKAYWSLEASILSTQSEDKISKPDAALFKLDALINDSVELQSKADVPLGAFLSGGVDSSIVTAYMQSQSSVPVNTFTIGFDDEKFNEAKFAKNIADYLGTNHTEYYINESNLLDVVPTLPDIYDEPFADSSQIPTVIVGALAKKKVSVALSGDGGDELFCGYGRYERTVKRWKSISKVPRTFRSLIGSASTLIPPRYNIAYDRVLSNTPRGLIRTLDYLGCSEFKDFYKRSVSSLENCEQVIKGADGVATVYDKSQLAGDAFYEHMMISDTLQYLPDDILVKVDRAFMSSSLEGRIPLLDHRIAEFAWRVPVDIHRYDGKGKYLLRELLYRKVPKNLIDRPKMGFAIPLADWLRGPLLDWSEQLLSENRLEDDGIFDVKFVSGIWQQHKLHIADWSTLLWSVIMFNAWYEKQ